MATTIPPTGESGGAPVGDAASAGDAGLVRFDLPSRMFHWTNAFGWLTLIATGALMYFPVFAGLVPDRYVVRNVHTWGGWLTVAVAVVAFGGPWGRNLRADVATIDAFDVADRRWLRGGWRDELAGRGSDHGTGRFNAGQKLNAAATAAGLVVMAGTGTIMAFHADFPAWLKAGAVFVHDLTAFGLTLIVAGHIVMSLRDRGAMRGMLTGRVSAAWARLHHDAWAAQADRPGQNGWAAQADRPGQNGWAAQADRR